ncbi:unnamed protein product [Rhodiola kirilowii]
MRSFSKDKRISKEYSGDTSVASRRNTFGVSTLLITYYSSVFNP